MKDLHNKIEVTSILSPIVVTADATYDDIDLAGYNSAELVIDIGADGGSGLGETNYFTFTLYDSDDGTTYAVVETADVLGAGTITSGIILTVNHTDEDNTLYHFGYVGGKRYLRLIALEEGTCSCAMGISIIKSDMLDSPVVS